jgi:hypothetical protein
MSRLALFAPLALVTLATPALAHDSVAVSVQVDVAGHHRYHEAPAWVQPTGPQIYYGRHYTHAPAYPEPHLANAYPVPVFRGASPLPVVGYASPAHVEWCYTRYRSYRLSDNSFQPHQGVRRACRSPYY